VVSPKGYSPTSAFPGSDGVLQRTICILPDVESFFLNRPPFFLPPILKAPSFPVPQREFGFFLLRDLCVILADSVLDPLSSKGLSFPFIPRRTRSSPSSLAFCKSTILSSAGAAPRPPFLGSPPSSSDFSLCLTICLP